MIFVGIVACLWALVIFGFVITFFVDWFRLRPHIVKYLKFGLLIGGLVIGIDLVFLLLSPELWTVPFLVQITFMEPIVLIRMIGFTMLGMYYAAALGYPSLPLLLRLFPLPPEPTVILAEANVEPAASEPAGAEMVSEPEEPAYFIDGQTLEKVEMPLFRPAEADPAVFKTPLVASPPPPPQDVLLTSSGADYALKVTAVTCVGIIYSILLFWFTNPRMSEIMQNMVTNMGQTNTNTPQITWVMMLIFIEVAIAEEVMFRLGIQNFIARYLNLTENRYWIAIGLTTLLWTWGHVGSLSPEWVKMAQIFPIGLILGWLYKRYGLESVIIVHGVFNVVLGFLSPYLIGQ